MDGLLMHFQKKCSQKGNTMSQDGTQSVLIIGAGHTGMTAALELARFGIKVRIIEKTHEPATTSRAVGVQARTLELLEQRGLAAQLVEAGHPGLAASIYGSGKRFFRQDFSHIDSRYNYLLFVSQAETERILREALEKLGVKIERGVEMIAFVQPEQANEVTATLRHEDGSLEEVTAFYMISAEGAHSLVRSSLHLPFLRIWLHGSFPHGAPALSLDCQQSIQQAEQRYYARAR
jgi:2-polyprenyl-6-methoxyphenol hydroxylase-like FAD-dependent oxidoreductase